MRAVAAMETRRRWNNVGEVVERVWSRRASPYFRVDVDVKKEDSWSILRGKNKGANLSPRPHKKKKQNKIKKPNNDTQQHTKQINSSASLLTIRADDVLSTKNIKPQWWQQ